MCPKTKKITEGETQMSQAFERILTGQICLIICCVLYLIWWSVSYRPGEEVSRATGPRGILLFCTAAAGIVGIVFCVYGMNSVSTVNEAPLSGGIICLAGIAAYIVLLLITKIGFHRPVTTELLLITGWAVLELCLINAAYGAGALNKSMYVVTTAVIAAAVVISLILYVLYYRMEAWKAFHAAMVPLITEAVSMALVSCILFVSAEGAAGGSSGESASVESQGTSEEIYAAMTGTGADDDPVEWTGMYFDTSISIRLYGDDAREWMEGAVEYCAKMENTLSAQKETSELYKVNHRTEQTVTVSDELAECISEGLKYSEMSDGAFDITILPVKDLWDFESEDHTGEVPDDNAIQEELKKVDYTKVHLDGNTLTFDSADTMIDLGGIAKGYISAKLKEYLVDQGCMSGLINLGGNVSVIGSKPDGSDWTVGIQTPFDDRGTVLTTVSVSDTSVISSGIYERYFEVDGTIYHHILDPRTGYPAETDLNQVTVIGDDDVAGDALATIGIVLGKDGMEQFLEENGLDQTEQVIFTDRDNEVSYFPEESD
jgi:thiamine biosynthesis lipoprotein